MKKILIALLVFLCGGQASAQVNVEPVVIDTEGAVFYQDSSQVSIPAFVNFEYLPNGLDSVQIKWRLVNDLTGEVSESGNTSVTVKNPDFLITGKVPANILVICEAYSAQRREYVIYLPFPPSE